jgi:hypothetical protein
MAKASVSARPKNVPRVDPHIMKTETQNNAKIGEKRSLRLQRRKFTDQPGVTVFNRHPPHFSIAVWTKGYWREFFPMRVVAQDIDEVTRFRVSNCCFDGIEITFMSGLGFARLPKQGLGQDGILIGIFEKS